MATSLHQLQWLRQRWHAEQAVRIPSPPPGRQTVQIGVSFVQDNGYGAAGRVHTGYLYMPVVQARRTSGNAGFCRLWAYPEKLLVSTG
ncbi:hypothetical protein IFM47457_07333 [Aspergillus lentulus]|nr:hypothetical protein IFM47457_07333 [Aspergillus lentulus]